MLLRTSLLEAVRHPALWRRIDISSNRPRHPAYTKAEKDQQEGLCTLAALDHQYKEENNRPGDGKSSTVDPIVSISIHLISRSFHSSPCAGKNPDERALTTLKKPISPCAFSIPHYQKNDAEFHCLSQNSPLSGLPGNIIGNIQG